jgi:hypothetical protein
VYSLWGTRRCPRCTLQLTPPPPPGSQSLSPLPRKKNFLIFISLFLRKSRENFSPNVKTVKEKLCENRNFRKIFLARCLLATCLLINGTQFNQTFLNVETVYIKITQKLYKLVSCDF